MNPIGFVIAKSVGLTAMSETGLATLNWVFLCAALYTLYVHGAFEPTRETIMLEGSKK